LDLLVVMSKNSQKEVLWKDTLNMISIRRQISIGVIINYYQSLFKLNIFNTSIPVYRGLHGI
jgi:hypothetical protein